MIPVNEARKIISENIINFGTRTINFRESNGLILSEDVTADRDFPPFDRVTMDGIAINSPILNQGQKVFKLEGMQPAGAKRTSLLDPHNAMEVMTGSVLPENTDAVIRYEDLEISEINGDRVARIEIDTIEVSKNIHRKGEDRKNGDLLIAKGTLIGSPEIAVLATSGKMEVKVYDFPNTAIISTGDELVNVDEKPLEHQIRKSNIYAISNELKQLGVHSEMFHLKDDKDLIESKIGEIIKTFPVVILSGGVSKGKLDFVPGILEKLGIKRKFYTVSQRPGKPLWFGCSERNVVFALPGNPVSTYMCFLVYVRPWYLRCLKLKPVPEFAVLDTDISFTPNLTYFLQVRVNFGKNSKLMATPLRGHGSGDLANLIDVDGFLELPIGQTLYSRGSSYHFHSFRRNKIISELNTQTTK